MTARTRTSANCLNAAMADLSRNAAAMVTNRAMLDLIEAHEQRQREAFARIDALLLECRA